MKASRNINAMALNDKATKQDKRRAKQHGAFNMEEII